ncbi:MAG: transporter substrate-binding domain-containing protein [Oligoflexales bacterium]|nr:transporter substrate-binding domain-containing protein [Oligoflexales bacterium]
MFDRISIIISFLVFSLSAALFSQTKQPQVCNKRELIIPWEEYSPYQFRENNVVTGIDYEILNEVLKRMNCRYVAPVSPWKRTLAGLETGEVDISGSASITEDRKKFAYFSDSYVISQNVMFVQRGEGSRYDFNSLKDVLNAPKDFTVGVTNMYEYGDDFAAASKDPKFTSHLVTSQSEDITMRILINKRITAAIANKYTGLWFAKGMGALDKIEVHKMKISEDPLTFIFSKKSINEDFVKQFNAHLKAINADGTLKKIIEKFTAVKDK